MGKLPYSRVVNVNLTRSDAFPSRRGFGIPLILTTTAVAGILDASHRTKVYGSIDEVAVDHIASTEVYKAAESAFAQNPRPLQIKVGFATFVPADDTAAELKTELAAIVAYDSDWYWLTILPAMRDKASLDGLVEWTEAQNRFDIIDSNDVNTQNAANDTSLAARIKGTAANSAVFYHTDAAEYPGIALAAALGTRNFDQADTAYTAKFKRLAGVAPLNLGSAAVQAITGFVPELGQSLEAGHMALAYVDVGGQPFVVEGSTATPNVFIDEVHATHWIIARTEEETLAVKLNNDRIPYTDSGMETLASGARMVMRVADRAGLIADDFDPETGLYAPAVVFDIPSVFSVPASQRKARVAPAIDITFRYSGAVHYTTIKYAMSF